jgi:hypothetical protein
MMMMIMMIIIIMMMMATWSYGFYDSGNEMNMGDV